MIAFEEQTERLDTRKEQASRLLDKMRSIPGRFTYAEEVSVEMVAEGGPLDKRHMDRYKHLCMMELQEEAK